MPNSTRRRERQQLRNNPNARAIRMLRDGMCLSQTDFAELVGCSVASLSAWENGETEPGKLAQRALLHTAHEAGHALDLTTSGDSVPRKPAPKSPTSIATALNNISGQRGKVVRLAPGRSS